MSESTFSSRSVLRAAVALASAALVFGAGPARAAVGFKTDSGWGFSSDGFINVFAVDQFASLNGGPPRDALMAETDKNIFRIRTGLLPGLVAFNAESPDLDGLKLRSRVGFYPQIQSQQTRVLNTTSPGYPNFGSQIDVREAFFTADASWGQVLAGRALNLFQGKNILTDYTLFGVGVAGRQIAAGGTTAGRIGFGYNYTSFGAQIRYTTPDMGGFKIAGQIGDPNAIGTFTETRLPDFEAEISYAKKYGDLAVQSWVSGMWQQAYAAGTETSVNALGVAGGLGINMGALDALVSGFYGKALGTIFMLQIDSVDAAGKERGSGGFLVQGAYTFGKATKLGLSYGRNMLEQTTADAGNAQLKARQSVTGGIYHDVNSALKLIAEYTWSQATYQDSAPNQTANTIALGAFMFW